MNDIEKEKALYNAALTLSAYAKAESFIENIIPYLRKSTEHRGHYKTDYGTKTKLGLIEMVLRVVGEAEAEREIDEDTPITEYNDKMIKRLTQIIRDETGNKEEKFIFINFLMNPLDDSEDKEVFAFVNIALANEYLKRLSSEIEKTRRSPLPIPRIYYVYGAYSIKVVSRLKEIFILPNLREAKVHRLVNGMIAKVSSKELII